MRTMNSFASAGRTALNAFELSLVDTLDTASDDLGNICAGVDSECENGNEYLIVGRSEDNKVDDHELNDYRGSSDDRKIYTADLVKDKKDAFADTAFEFFFQCVIR